ncbi:hypothetical protein BJY59DRAFT_692408 [Rhodotorula toruloides]
MLAVPNIRRGPPISSRFSPSAPVVRPEREVQVLQMERRAARVGERGRVDVGVGVVPGRVEEKGGRVSVGRVGVAAVGLGARELRTRLLRRLVRPRARRAPALLPARRRLLLVLRRPIRVAILELHERLGCVLRRFTRLILVALLVRALIHLIPLLHHPLQHLLLLLPLCPPFLPDLLSLALVESLEREGVDAFAGAGVLVGRRGEGEGAVVRVGRGHALRVEARKAVASSPGLVAGE